MGRGGATGTCRAILGNGVGRFPAGRVLLYRGSVLPGLTFPFLGLKKAGRRDEGILVEESLLLVMVGRLLLCFVMKSRAGIYHIMYLSSSSFFLSKTQ